VPTKSDKEMPAIQQFRERLRGAGLRSTGPRLAVLKYLFARRGPVSHADLNGALARHGFDRATIYRNLMDLTRVGIVTRSDLGDHVWRFELRGEAAGNEKDHPHFVCTDCGDVTCLPGVRVRITTPRGVPRAIRDEELKVQLKGRCDRCH
jgi:Fur family ferric uptake transcriptional regulator